MNNNIPHEALAGDVRKLSASERNTLIVSAVQLDDTWITLSRFGDEIWQLNGLPSNVKKYHSCINFQDIPKSFRDAMREVLYRYMFHGREGQKIPKGTTLIEFFRGALPFLRYLESLNVSRFGAVSLMIFANYAYECRELRKWNGRSLKKGTLASRFKMVEALCELSQYTHDPLPRHPWPDTSSLAMAGLTGIGSNHSHGGATLLIPDEVFCAIFEKAFELVKKGKMLLNLRDAISAIEIQYKCASYDVIKDRKCRRLTNLGWKYGLTTLNRDLLDLRTACYIVIASTSGCRNHELANVQSGSHHRTQDDEGNVYHWMRSKSEKTDTGIHDWMIPDAAVQALRTIERWAAPYQARIANEIAHLRRINPIDPEIAVALIHRNAVFLGASDKDNKIRTLSATSWGRSLKAFAKGAGQNWPLATHQFRRKFANYVAHSKFGDLRYLREHFAHWSMDMTLGYAMDDTWGENFELDLANEVQAELEHIKLNVVDEWLKNKSLAGGYGQSIKKWQRDPENLAIFKNHITMITSIAESTAIRSNGHAWCTADNHSCIGNTLERTRCGDCTKAVIGPDHLRIYQRLHRNLTELLLCSDIGESGRIRVLRDIERCRNVFNQFGLNIPEHTT